MSSAVARYLPSIGAAVCLLIGAALVKRYGSATGFGFMLVVSLLLIAGNVVLRELTSRRRQRFRAQIQQLLRGEAMCDHLRRNPGHLHDWRTSPSGARAALLEVLDADDARCVRQLLENGSLAE